MAAYDDCLMEEMDFYQNLVHDEVDEFYELTGDITSLFFQITIQLPYWRREMSIDAKIRDAKKKYLPKSINNSSSNQTLES